MSRHRYIWDKDLECLVEIGEGANRPEPPKLVRSAQVMPDLQPYRAVASDIASKGKRPVIGGRAQHREFLRRNGYIEVGNDYVPPRREELTRHERIADIKRAMGE